MGHDYRHCYPNNAPGVQQKDDLALTISLDKRPRTSRWYLNNGKSSLIPTESIRTWKEINYSTSSHRALKFWISLNAGRAFLAGYHIYIYIIYIYIYTFATCINIDVHGCTRTCIRMNTEIYAYRLTSTYVYKYTLKVLSNISHPIKPYSLTLPWPKARNHCALPVKLHK